MKSLVAGKASFVALLAATTMAIVGACQTPDSSTSVGCKGTTCSGNDLWSSTGQPVVTSSVPPLPISGGTLMVSRDGRSAIASDPDRDRIVVVDVMGLNVRATLATNRGADPGRSVEDLGGRAHVILRHASAIMTIDLASGGLRSVTPVCEDPRGIAFDDTTNQLYLACSGGDIFTLTAQDQPKRVRDVRIGDDLRDVALVGSQLFVSHFRKASVDVLDVSGNVIREVTLAGHWFEESTFEADVAWRMIRVPDGVVIAHQQARVDQIVVDEASSNAPGQSADPAPYVGIDCPSGIIHSAVTKLDANGTQVGPRDGGGLSEMTLPVDVAISTSGSKLAVLAAGSGKIVEASPDYLLNEDGCTSNQPGKGFIDAKGAAVYSKDRSLRVMPTSPEPIALAYGNQDALIVQTREPSTLEIHDPVSGSISAVIALGGDSRRDTAHRMFHANPDSASVPIACASCHPEGRDDGHVWLFQDQGLRRTQSLASFSPASAPFHWEGDIASVDALVDEVFVHRMGGERQSKERTTALEGWLAQMPAAPRSIGANAQAASRGEALFFDATVGCSSCHSGSAYTDNQTVDVGTGRAFQVPSLIGVGARSPYLHDGCAATLKDRFNSACGGGDRHGHTSQLTDSQVDDLVAFLERL